MGFDCGPAPGSPREVVALYGPCDRCHRTSRGPWWQAGFSLICERCRVKMLPRSAFDLSWWERLVAWFRRRDAAVVVCKVCGWWSWVRLTGIEAVQFEARQRLAQHQCQRLPATGFYAPSLPPANPVPPHLRGMGARTTRGEPDPFERAGVVPSFVQHATGRPPPLPTPMPGPGRKVMK